VGKKKEELMRATKTLSVPGERSSKKEDACDNTPQDMR